MDKATWEELKAQNVDAVSRTSSKKLFAYGQTEPIEILGTFDAKITCDVTSVSCEDQFTVIQFTCYMWDLLGRAYIRSLPRGLMRM